MLSHRMIGSLSVSAIGLGCMNLSHAYGHPLTDPEGAALLNRALDLGVTMLDTAALYGLGANERLIGKSVMHRRSEFILASKCVLDFVDGERRLDGSSEAITRTLDAALGRLATDHIDLYYLHRLDGRIPIEESVSALVRAKDAGKIRAIGLSEMSAATVRRAHAIHPITAIQSEYSPVVRNPEIAVLDTCRELGIGFVAFSPVGRGLLAGSIRSDDYVEKDIRRAMPRFVEPNLSHNLIAVGAFAALASELGWSPAQLSLAWVLSRGNLIAAIPGTCNLGHLEENIAAGSLRLPAEAAAQIEAIFAPGAIEGARYSAPMQAQMDTEIFPNEQLA
jgi:aryl-alcohol dehydrogenase-like predicted oxidoreductase